MPIHNGFNGRMSPRREPVKQQEFSYRLGIFDGEETSRAAFRSSRLEGRRGGGAEGHKKHKKIHSAVSSNISQDYSQHGACTLIIVSRLSLLYRY
jgi:hypothetical protein